jgi:prepilin-type N-terminal cleavage/methylation domain-containing protein
MKKRNPWSKKGVTLIELLIALVISTVLIAGIYRMFIHQQMTYATQEQVADMQQNVRVAINRMVREIRMAGYGGKNENTGGTNDIIKTFGNVNTYTNVINPENDVVEDGITYDRITVVAAYGSIGKLSADANANDDKVTVDYDGSSPFATKNTKKRYLCLNGLNNYEIDMDNVTGDQVPLKTGTKLLENHLKGEPVLLVKAITYGLRMSNGAPVLYRNENTDGGRQPVAENIESLGLLYTLVDGTQTDAPADPRRIRGVTVNITARTENRDPDLAKVGDGYRRRTVTTYIDMRNVRDDPE